jgi:uncharacterized OsmC-like protein
VARHGPRRGRRPDDGVRRAERHGLQLQDPLRGRAGDQSGGAAGRRPRGLLHHALAFALQQAGLTPLELATEAAVSLDPADGGGFRISRSALTLRAKVPGLDEARFQALAKEAEKNCPVSKVLNAEITLDAKLES